VASRRGADISAEKALSFVLTALGMLAAQDSEGHESDLLGELDLQDSGDGESEILGDFESSPLHWPRPERPQTGADATADDGL
jgi:hypothetical protein